MDTGQPQTEQKSPESAPPKFDFTALMEVFKSLGIIAGSLGSVAVLFFWIGNAIIVARLRAYNLYGIVHYTDEYVTEAGYQFFQDIFTFFQEWKLILLFALIMALLLVMIPVGGQAAGKDEGDPGVPWMKWPAYLISFIRRRKIHYAVFLAMALSASAALTTDWFVRRLSSDIIRQERLLDDVAGQMRGKLLILTPRKGANGLATEFQKRFYEELTLDEKPTREWLEESLGRLYKIEGDPRLLARFQKEFNIPEGAGFKFDGDFEKSQTYGTLLNIRLSEKLTGELESKVSQTLQDFRSLLSGHLKSEGDTSSLVLIPANHDTASDSIRRLKRMSANILTFFEPGDNETREIFGRLERIKPIAFGQFLISYSFWVLIGVLVYLLLNSPRLLRFEQWEIGYFTLMMLLFLTILITLPTAYGRYRFEFKIQKLNDIVFEGDEKGENPLRKKIEELRGMNANLYILGPTKGKEVIVGAVQSPAAGGAGAPRIIMLEREAVKYMNVEPVRPEDIPGMIRLLRQKAETAKKELIDLSAVR